MTDYQTELAAAREAAARASAMLRTEYEAFAAIPDAPVTISTHADKASQELILVTRRGATFVERRVLPVRFVPMTGKVRQ